MNWALTVCCRNDVAVTVTLLFSYFTADLHSLLNLVYKWCIVCLDISHLQIVFLHPPFVKVKDTICNLVVMSVLLSVCNKPRPLMSQAIISLGQADAKLPGNWHLVGFGPNLSWYIYSSPVSHSEFMALY